VTTDPLQGAADYLGQTVEGVEATARWLAANHRALLNEPSPLGLPVRAGSTVGKSFTPAEPLRRRMTCGHGWRPAAEARLRGFLAEIDRHADLVAGSFWHGPAWYWQQVGREVVRLPPPLVVRLALEGS
jgi:hypothetical protein